MRPEQFAAATEISSGIAWGGLSGHKTVNDNKRTPKKLLWVDDSSALLSLYQAVFENLGFEVVTTSSAGEALDCAASFGADLVILDYDMPVMNGAQLAAILKDRNPFLPVVLYSGSDSISADAYRWVDAICAKAAPREELLATIERLLPSAARRKPCRSQSVQSVSTTSVSASPLQLIESGIAVPPSSSARASNHSASNV
jgi:two-component system response regulator FlrC